MRKFILWHYDLGRSNLLLRVSVCRRCRVGIDRYPVSITYSGPEIKGGCTQPEGPRWEGLFCSPTWLHPTPCRNQATSVSWLSACTQKPERRKQVSCVFFSVSPCGIPRREIRPPLRVPCIVSKQDFTPAKCQSWLLVKCSVPKKLSWDPFVIYFLWESKKNEKKKKREKGQGISPPHLRGEYAKETLFQQV